MKRYKFTLHDTLDATIFNPSNSPDANFVLYVEATAIIHSVLLKLAIEQLLRYEASL